MEYYRRILSQLQKNAVNHRTKLRFVNYDKLISTLAKM